MVDYQTIKAGDILVSTPNSSKGMLYSKSVILIISSDKNGSSGVIVNKILNTLEGKEINESLHINKNKIIKDTITINDEARLPVFFGGPVEQERGIIIHSEEDTIGPKINISPGIFISTNAKIINDIALDKGPLHKMLILGYVSWTADQLSNEIKQDNWILLPNFTFTEELSPIFRLLFIEDPAYRWKFALSIAHIKKHNYCNSFGNA